MPHWFRATALIAACVALTACSLAAGGPAITDQVWMLDKAYPTSSFAENEGFIPTACPSTDDAANKLTQPEINQCVYAMLQMIDVKWVHFQDQLLASSSTTNFAADTTLLGIGAAGSFVSGGATQILHAVSAGVTGMRSSFNQDILYSQTITTLLLQMEADRTAARAIIMARLTGKAPPTPATANAPASPSSLDISPYTNMYQAANDLFFYARAGSWTHALLSIQKSAANSKGNVPSGGTPAPSQ